MAGNGFGGVDRRRFLLGGAAIGAGGLLVGCTSNSPDTGGGKAAVGGNDAGDNAKAGRQVFIGFAGPQADHGWLNAINENASAQAKTYPDVTFEITEGSNDAAQQAGQIETLIGKKPDCLVILPADGKAMTDAGKKAMEAGIPVVNLDRIFDSPLAYRTWIGGDNYAMGFNAGKFIGERLKGKPDARILELAGIDSLPLTQQRSQGFKDALATYGLKVAARQAAEFTVESGQAKMSQLLSANPRFDALWNHDDDQGVGALQAIEQAGRDDFIMVGGAGAKSAMEHIKADDTPLKATVLYPCTMSASAVSLARLIAQGRSMGDLVEPEVPASITLFSAVVTKDNVDQYINTPVAFT